METDKTNNFKFSYEKKSAQKWKPFVEWPKDLRMNDFLYPPVIILREEVSEREICGFLSNDIAGTPMRYEGRWHDGGFFKRSVTNIIRELLLEFYCEIFEQPIQPTPGYIAQNIALVFLLNVLRSISSAYLDVCLRTGNPIINSFIKTKGKEIIHIEVVMFLIDLLTLFTIKYLS